MPAKSKKACPELPPQEKPQFYIKLSFMVKQANLVGWENGVKRNQSWAEVTLEPG